MKVWHRGRSVVLVALATVAGIGWLAGANAHGTLDQELVDRPACDDTAFRGFVSSVWPLRQEFVPVRRGLVAVDLCLDFLNDSETLVTARVLTGTAESPADVIGTASVTVSQAGFQWVHIDFPAELELAPGTLYVLELPTSGTFQWRSACCGGGQDRYPAGGAALEYSDGTVEPRESDFGFRTFTGPFGIAALLAKDG